jgi:hypothetical protein
VRGGGPTPGIRARRRCLDLIVTFVELGVGDGVSDADA